MIRQKKTRKQWLRDAIIVVLFLPLIVPLVVIALVLHWSHRFTLYLLVWALWLPKGKDFLVVCSDSPIWREYMTTEVLPLLEDRAIVLNWSERKRWPRFSLRVLVFRSFGGGREFNPLVVFFKPYCRARIFRFWNPFKDWKRGDKEPVQRLSQEIFSVL
jgi:hypothetical protein